MRSGAFGGLFLVYVTGDIHGQLSRFDAPEIKRLRKEDTRLICGDFGFIWDGGREEEAALKKIGKRRFVTAFVDGTHENFDLLSQYETVDWMGGKAQHITGNLYRLLRGQVYTIEGKTFFTFGGGESPDRELRMEQHKWWKEEMPTIAEMRAGVDALDAVDRRVDYLITHAPPGRVRGLLKTEDDSMMNALAVYFEELSGAVSFEKWFFGSLHIDRQFSAKYYAVFSGVQPVWTPETKRARR